MSGTTSRDSTGRALMWSVKTPTFVCATLCLISDTVNEIDVDFSGLNSRFSGIHAGSVSPGQDTAILGQGPPLDSLRTPLQPSLVGIT